MCEDRVQIETKARVDLQTEMLKGEAEMLFTDGCCFRHSTEGLKAGYGVVRRTKEGQYEVVSAGLVTKQPSAQTAELVAMIEALKWVKGKRVTIYSDSAFVVGAALVELPQWLRAGFLTAGGKLIRHQEQMRELAEAILLPAEVAIVKCRGHAGDQGAVAQGNNRADEVAKQAAGYKDGDNRMMVSQEVIDLLPEFTKEVIVKEQERVDPQEKSLWKQRGATQTEGWWRSADGIVVLPQGELRRAVFKEAHGLGHIGVKQMMRQMGGWWHPFLEDLIKHHVKSCVGCNEFNQKSTVKVTAGVFSIRTFPGEEIIIDFTDMIDRVGGKRYLLVAVDAYRGWPEARPTGKEDAKAIADKHQQQGTADPRTVKYVRLKVIRRKWSEPGWTGPFEVVERTSHAVRLKGKGDIWFHWSMTTPAEKPQRSIE
ncbi:hypothetical protein Q8A73_005793 [Channa argus]|nr:hypothetical protein Q8A73_005793 [Channa argus]